MMKTYKINPDFYINTKKKQLIIKILTKLFFFILLAFLSYLLFVDIFYSKMKNRYFLNLLTFNKQKRKIKDWEKEDIKNIKIIEEYIKNLNNSLIISQKETINNKNKKIELSFIMPLFNKKNYLSLFILSIQNQLMKSCELVFIDDLSTDSSVQIIREYQKIDKRIILSINLQNRGTFYSRYIGSILSKGNFIHFADPDDLILKEGIFYSINMMEKKKLDMIHFSFHDQVRGKIYRFLNEDINNNEIIFQPELSNYKFYQNNKLRTTFNFLWNKIIQKDTIIRTYNFIGKKYIEKKFSIGTDLILLYGIFRNAKNFGYLNMIGYCYIINRDSISNTLDHPNKLFKTLFFWLEYFYEKTLLIRYDKLICIEMVKFIFSTYKKSYKKLNRGFDLLEKTFSMIINCQYFNNNDKSILKSYKKRITNKKKNK